MVIKAVILIGGPEKGTRFRPLSLDMPKPLFPVAGIPLIQHHIEACCKVPDMREVLLIGYFQPSEQLMLFLNEMAEKCEHVIIRYLQEFAPMGTAGCIYHFRDQILFGNPEAIFLMHGDICADFRLDKMLMFHKSRDNATVTLMGTEAIPSQSVEFGCIVENKATHQVIHYVEKPKSYVSSLINCGIYILSPRVFVLLSRIIQAKTKNGFGPDYINTVEGGSRRGSSASMFYSTIGAPSEALSLENDVITRLAIGDPAVEGNSGAAYVYHTEGWWSQIKTAGAAIYANRHCLKLYQKSHVELLAQAGKNMPKIIGHVYIHPSARVHETAVIGPNVSIHKNVIIGAGARVRDAIVLNDVSIQENSCVLNSIIGWGSSIGSWTRIEGTPNDPNPDKPFAKLEHVPLFSEKGYLNPSITILGSKVNVPSELMVLNSIVLPKKDLAHSYKNQIIL